MLLLMLHLLLLLLIELACGSLQPTATGSGGATVLLVI